MVKLLQQITVSSSPWVKWADRKTLEGIDSPGTYILAISENDISSRDFAMIENIVYIGMTNSNAGLKGRLQQFDDTIRWKTGHGGAMRVRKKHASYETLSPQLYASVRVFSCNPREDSPEILRIKGLVAQDEYNLWADFFAEFGRLPEFNDKKISPKA